MGAKVTLQALLLKYFYSLSFLFADYPTILTVSTVLKIKHFMKTLLSVTAFFIYTFASAQSESKFIVNFDYNQSAITVATQQQLDSFLSVKNNETKIKLYGHCDSVGTNIKNDPLSDDRVENIETYLTLNGFKRNNILETKGFGKRKPLNSNATSQERALNRRVEITVIQMPPQATVINCGHWLDKKIEDTSSKVGTTIVLKDLNFYGGLHHILPQSVPVVQDLVDVMKKNKTLAIAIQGHICCQPGDGDGIDMETRTINLSVNRAKAIYDILLQNGIDSTRLSYKGYGHAQALAAFPEKTPEEQINNRRVEIRIVKR
jgi:outer membrane protein OmpA-like peptidoglycan-associated protein